jgi:hypothetical protein
MSVKEEVGNIKLTGLYPPAGHREHENVENATQVTIEIRCV